MIKPNKIIVIGGNAAGPAAAAKAKRVNPAAEVILFEIGDFISTGTCEIPYVLSGAIADYKKIIYFTAEEFYKKKNVKVFTNHLVEKIGRKEKALTVKNLKKNSVTNYFYDKLILATGSVSKELKDFSSNLNNVYYLKSVSDLLEIQKRNNDAKIKNVVIIGAGYIGLEAAEAFSHLGINVIILEKEIRPLPSADPEIQYLVDELLKQNNIRFYQIHKNFKIQIENNSVKNINLDSRLLEFDIVLVAAGFLPNVKLAKDSGLEIETNGAIKVDSKLRTSDQHIYAAGDNITVVNFITGRADYIPLATIAHEFGHIAGENAAGGNKTALPVVKNIAVKIFNKYYVQVGLSDTEIKKGKYLVAEVSAVVPNLVEVMPGSEKVFGKIIFEKNNKRILGASFFGGKEVSGYGDLISALIKTKQDVRVLASLNYNYTPPLSPFVNLLSVLGRQIK